MTTSQQAFSEAKKYFPGGVNSPVRSFQAVGGTPPFIHHARGAYLYDLDGNKYLDFCLSWGALLLGHAHPEVLRAVQKTMYNGTTFGAPTLLETELAKIVTAAIPSIEQLRFVNSGTEATMSAIKLAKAFTGRPTVIMIEGGYHGHAEYPDIVRVPFNNNQALEKIFAKHKNKIAALIIEPVPANMGVVLPLPGYLDFVRKITADNKTVLIFDEVITGFRLGLSGAQGLFGITPDLTCLGKIVGGGLPAAAYGGKKEIMSLLAPLGEVYQAGTLSGNPVAMAAGIATLQELRKPKVYAYLQQQTDYFFSKLRSFLPEHMQLNNIGPMFTLFFTKEKVIDYTSAKTSDTKKFATFYHQLLEAGIYFSPAQFEANFISVKHTPGALNSVLNKLQEPL
jgi:glutamate-1-semialdehyde 2,1-aminomutase